MVHGRAGLYLEAWKFSVYISIPVIASVYYSNPETQKYWADYWQFIKYPENPNVNVKQQIEELIKERQKQEESSKIYQQQLQSLQQAANRSKQYQQQASSSAIAVSDAASSSEDSKSSLSWWRRLGRWVSRSD